MVAFYIIVFAAAGGLLLAARKIRALSSRIEELELRDRHNEAILRALVGRVYNLEHGGDAALQQDSPPALQEEQTAQSISASEPLLTEPPLAGTSPQPPAFEEDWESVVGGSWLNKVGVLILVVGIALFLGYSLTQLGPAGKVFIGLAVGVSMLGGGVLLERKPQYRSFAWGLIGGGWAAIYFTVYAMHGLPAARFIHDPLVATALLLAVSAAMVAHSFRYHSEAVTGVAYFVGFITLNVTPLTSFSVVATGLLAASLILIAHRFDWGGLALAGVALTYFTFALRYDPAIYGRSGLLNGQATLWTYWLLFEVFDLLNLRRGILVRIQDHRVTGSLFAINACGFVGASLLHDSFMNSRDWSIFLSAAAAAYLASALIRARLAPLSDSSGSAAARALFGGYEGALTAAAALSAAAVIERFSGIRITLGLLFLGELLVLCGVGLRNSFVRSLGAAVLFLPFFRMLAVDMQTAQRTAVPGERWMASSPLALLMAGAFYMNRALTGSGFLYNPAASLLLAIVIGMELASSYVAVAWTMMAIAGLLAGIKVQSRLTRWQAYVIALAAFARVCLVNFDLPAAAMRILTISLVVSGFYLCQFLIPEASSAVEKHGRVFFSVLATILLTVLLFNEVQGRLMTVAWGVEGVSLLALGFVLRERIFRISGLVLFLLCIGKLFVYDLRELDTLSRIFSFIVLGLLLLGASWIYTRFREEIRRML